MPRKAMNYDKTYFYRIVCKDLNVKDCYVGHTTNFIKRKSKHKQDCNIETNKAYNTPVYKFIRANGGWENWDMILIEECCCKDTLEAEAKERNHMETLGATLNKYRPTLTDEERIEYKKRCEKEWKQNNREHYLQYLKEWRAKKAETSSSEEGI